MRLPSLRFLRSRKFWQRSVFAFACLITFVAAAYAIENYRGRSAWEEYQREAIARGEKLKIEEFIKPPIPDEKNFAAIPIFQELQSKDAQVREQAQSKVRIPLDSADGKLHGSTGGRTNEDPLNFDNWRKIFLSHALIDTITDDAAADVLRALDRYEPVLSQLREAAQERPLSRLNAGWEKGFQADFFNMGNLLDLARLLSLRTSALLATGRQDDALENWRVSYRLCETLRGEPSLLAGMLRVMMLEITIAPIWEGLTAHQWTAPQLREVGAALQTINLREEYTFFLGGERALINKTLENFARTGSPKLSGRSPRSFNFLPDVESLFPTGWVYQNNVRINQWFDRAIAKSRVPVPVSSHDEDRPWRNRRWWQWPYYLIFDAAVWGFGGNQEVVTNTQVEILLCRAAIAVERHYLRTGRPPAQLADLVPAELEQVPNDPFSSDSLRYVHREDGTCLLYSVGPDGDDGGSRWKDIVWVWTSAPARRN